MVSVRPSKRSMTRPLSPLKCTVLIPELYRKANIDSGTAELNELEARLKAAEERLAKVSRSSSPAPRPQLNTGAALSSSPRNEQQTAGATSKTSPLAQKPTYPADRPPTAPRPRKDREDTQMLMSGMPGHLPSTPRLQSATNDYVMVESQGSRNTAEY